MKITITNLRLLRTLAGFAAICATFLLGAASQTASAQSMVDYLTSQPDPSLNFSARQPSKSFSHQGQNVPVVQASTVKTVGDLPTSSTIGSALNKQPVQQAAPSLVDHPKSIVQQASCRSCNTSSCGGSCGSSSRYGSYSAGINPCGIPCDPYCYVIAESVVMERRGDGGLTYSPNFGLPSVDFEWAPRITIGTVPDCVHGYELTWVGPLSWDRSSFITDANANLSTFLTTNSTIAASNLSAFNNATAQTQDYDMEYWSIEGNKTLIGWDVAKLLVGARYVDYDEDFSFASQSSAGSGRLNSEVDNQLFGLQIGLDLLYPIGRFAYTDFRGRAGGYLNFGESGVDLTNAGNLILAGRAEDEELAGLFEIGSGITYQLGEILSVRAGTELWYLTGVGTAADQAGSVMTTSTGRSIRLDDDILFYGLSFGAELRL